MLYRFEIWRLVKKYWRTMDHYTLKIQEKSDKKSWKNSIGLIVNVKHAPKIGPSLKKWTQMRFDSSIHLF